MSSNREVISEQKRYGTINIALDFNGRYKTWKPKNDQYWNMRLCSSVKIFDIVMKYEAFGLQVAVEKCMELSIKMGCDTRYVHIPLMSSSVAPGWRNHIYRQPRIIQINKFGRKSWFVDFCRRSSPWRHIFREYC